MSALTLNYKYTVGLFILIAGSVVVENAAFAGEIGYSDNSFVPDTTLTAGDLNDKFNEIKTVVNGNAATVGFVSSTLITQLDINDIIIQQVTITTPGPGKVIVSFSASYGMIHTNTIADQIQVGILDDSPSPVVWNTLPSRRILYLDGGFATGEFDGSVASQAVFTVDSAGEHTFNVWGSSPTNNSNAFVSNPATQAIFVPHPYP